MKPPSAVSSFDLPDAKRSLLEALLEEEGLLHGASPVISKRTDRGPCPLSFAQQRLWFFDQLAPGNPFYNVDIAMPLPGDIDVAALERSLQEIVRRHDVLRTTFLATSGGPVQVIAPSLSLPFPIIDLRPSAPTERQAMAEKLATEEARRPFDLAGGPLVRTTLLRLDDADYIFLLTMHHIVCDGWSLAVFYYELSVLYAAFSTGAASPLPELPIQYADFAVWQRQWLQGEELVAQLAYWRKQLADLPALNLPTDRPRPSVQSFQGAHHPITLSKELSEELRAFSQRQGVTLFMTMLAAFQVVLHRYSGQDDVVVGTYIANRNRAEIEGLIGFFVNTLVLRTDLSGNPSFREVLGRVREVALGAYAHQDLPFEKLVEELQPERDLSRNPLFQVTFQLFNMPASTTTDVETSAPTLQVERGTAIFDIAFGLFETSMGLVGQIEYSTDLFDADTIARLAGHYQRLLETIVADPDQRISTWPLLNEAERRHMLVAWNDTRSAFSRDACVHHLFEAQADRTPDAVAFSCGSQQLGYQELNVRANRLAHHLQAIGVGPETPVAIAMDRSPEMMVSLLGILKAGGAYVPLDPAYPAERLAFMIRETQAPVLLTEKRLRHRFGHHDAVTICVDDEPEGMSRGNADNPDSGTTASSLLYIMYTSGSTGIPKGVLGEHRAAVNRFEWMSQAYPFQPDEVCCQKTALSFVDSVWEIFGPLLNGVHNVILPDDLVKDSYALVGALAEQGVTRIVLVPSLLSVILSSGLDLRTELRRLKYWITSGEALPIELLQQFRDLLPEVVLLNLYGSSEVAGDATWFDTREEQSSSSVSIGRPIANTSVYVLDRHLQPVPVGVPGELYVGGQSVARGYLRRPELNAQRFIPDPFGGEPGARLYKTGDLARYRANGALEFLGRADHQLKIRGFRVEPGEIEAALRQHPRVREAVVVPKAGGDGDPQLVAYVVQDDSGDRGPVNDASNEQTERWHMVWDETYNRASAPDDPTFNIEGWNSSYTGAPIPSDEMRDWVNGTVERILALRPTRALEIGCGSGLLLFRIAPHCAVYQGTDFSAAALRYITENLAGRELDHVRLLERKADDFSGFEAGSVDAVILNSVVQYFPGIDYLVAMIEQCVRLVAPGGFIFIGDVRSLPLLKALHTSVELFRAPASLRLEQLEQRVNRRMAQEQELVIDPSFFVALQQHLPAVRDVRVQLRRGRQHNELTRFRYDVTLRVAADVGSAAECDWVEWGERVASIEDLRGYLTENPRPMAAVRSVPNARVLADARSVELIGSDAPFETVGELTECLAALNGNGVDPEALWALGNEMDRDVDIRWVGSSTDGCFDAVFVRRDRTNAGSVAATSFPSERQRMRPWRTYANDPRETSFAQQLVPELRRFLQDRLPEYMLPSVFVLITSLPTTPSGKVDRRSLPAPDRRRRETQGAYVAPRSDTEGLLATIWSELLGVDQVGVHDDFFSELGGHSLLGTRLITRLRETFQIELPIRRLFEGPTIAELALAIEELLIDDIEQTSDEADAVNGWDHESSA
jgi:amino acid adenylation domain-containing protein